MEKTESSAVPADSGRFRGLVKSRESLAAARVKPPDILQIGVPVTDRFMGPAMRHVMDVFAKVMAERRLEVLAENTKRLVQEATGVDDDINTMDIRHAN